MSVLSDYFQALANKIRSKTGKSDLLSVTDMVSEVDTVYDTGETAGVAETKVGTAAAGDVLTGKTFTNASSVGANGTMANNGAVSQTLNTSTTSYTIPAGYHNGSGQVSITTQTKTTTPGGAGKTVSPDSGKLLSSVSLNDLPFKTFFDSKIGSSNRINTYTHSGDQVSYVSYGYIDMTKLITSTGYWLVIGSTASPAVASWPASGVYGLCLYSKMVNSSTTDSSYNTYILKVTNLSSLSNMKIRWLTASVTTATEKYMSCLKLCDL